jgi:hypothetical protein
MALQLKISFLKGIPLTTGQCALAFATGIFELDHGEEGKYLKQKINYTYYTYYYT